MIDRIKRAWRRNRWLTLLFTAALLATIGFGVQTVSRAVYWSDPAHRNQAIEGWMSPRYVGMSYDLPPVVLGPLLGLDPSRPSRITMQEIADLRSMTLAEIEAIVRDAALAHNEDRP